MSSINRRRTYLNYLFENMTFLTIINPSVKYPSETFTVTPEYDNYTVNRDFITTLYTGNLSQYNMFMMIPCVYLDYMSNAKKSPLSVIVNSGGKIIFNEDSYIYTYYNISNNTSTQYGSPYFTETSVKDSYLNFSDDSIYFSTNVYGTLYRNGSVTVNMNILLSLDNRYEGYAIFGINE